MSNSGESAGASASSVMIVVQFIDFPKCFAGEGGQGQGPELRCGGIDDRRKQR